MNDIESLISTKFIPPPCGGEIVDRQRLLDSLSMQSPPIRLICAPAGFGKTTLLVSWLKLQGLPIAWLSLDENDNDALGFLSYLIGTIQNTFPDFVGKDDPILSLPQPPNIKFTLRALVNKLSQRDGDFVLALDDYHEITNEAVHEVLSFLIEYLPGSVQLVITSRTEVPIALSKMRVRRQLTEIGESDLRFNHHEAVLFLNEISGLALSMDDIAVLEARTEGWIAGLQLAALSLDGETDKTSFIRAFAGDDRFITDYLTDEVLKRQPKDIYLFLLQTSILERLNGSLCEKLTLNRNSSELLVQLEKSNMFLLPLDNKRHWYRYHHLFAELLREHLSRLFPEQLAILHRRASDWYLEQSLPPQAIRHAFAANDFVQATAILTEYGKEWFEAGQINNLLHWYQQLPRSVIKNDPCHMLRFTWCHFICYGEFLHDYVDELQRLNESNDLAIAEEYQLAMDIDLAMIGGFRALQQLNVAAAKELASKALEMGKVTDNANHLPPKLILAASCYVCGELQQAAAIFRQIVNDSFAQQYLITLNAAICGLGRVLVKQGHLQEARFHLTDSLARLKEKDWHEYLTDTVWIYLGLSDLAYLSNDLDACTRHLDEVVVAAARDNNDELPVLIDIRRAKIVLAKGNMNKGKECVNAIKVPQCKSALMPLFPHADDELFALQLSLGNLSTVKSWLSRKTELNGWDDLAPERESDGILFIRVLIAEHRYEEALHSITALLVAAEQGLRQSITIELLILQALARQAQNQIRQAIVAIERALRLAKSERYVRIFLDEGLAMTPLLKQAGQGSEGEYANYLLTLIDSDISNAKNSNRLIEPLSAKELKVLELLITGLSNREIADHVYVSINTVKSHLKNIYRKLDVTNRVEAASKGTHILQFL